MEKIDFKKTLKVLYAPSSKQFALVEVPRMTFLQLDGRGDPNTSPDYAAGVGWLYSLSYALKFASKASLGKDYMVPPLEALWWADDMADFTAGNKSAWHWRQMIMVPDFITGAMFDAALDKARAKLGVSPATLRLEAFEEGLSVQILHIGSYADEAPTIARLHAEFIPQHGLIENGLHHEIYLSDPRKTPAAKLKTIIRQPVRRKH
jgi:hypothetical protein